MSFRYARHWARIFNRPLLMEPGSFEAMLPSVERVFRAGVLPEPEAFVSVRTERGENSGLRMAGPVAVIPVLGPLYHRGHYTADCKYLTGYEDIAVMLRKAGEDPEAKVIAMAIDSPGGEVAGCFELAKSMKSMANGKAIVAMVNDQACSAAYAIASGADQVVSTETAQSGSIGVMLRHEDYSSYLEKLGVNVTLIHAGKHKVDGNPFEALGKDVRADLQAEIDRLYTMFVDLVASNRSIDATVVRDTEARTFMGEAALSLGLIDRIESPDQTLERLASEYSTQLPKSEYSFSTDPASAESSSSPIKSENTTMSLPESITTALGLPAEASEEQAVKAIQDSSKVAAQEERTRILGIIEHPEADGRIGVAVNLAKVVAMTPESAGEVMKAIPQIKVEEIETKPAADNQFAKMMSGLNPDVGLSDDDDAEQAKLKEARKGWASAFGLN
jgi:signal peptide peptidase SppA